MSLLQFNAKYLPGDVLENVITLNITGTVTAFTGGLILGKVNMRLAICLTSIIIFVGGVLIACAPPTTKMMPIYLIISIAGSQGLTLICPVVTTSMFPTLFSASANGICNIISKTLTIFAPFVAEMGAPIPMIILCVLSGFSALFSYFLCEHATMFEKSEEKPTDFATDPINDNEEDNLLQKENLQKED